LLTTITGKHIEITGAVRKYAEEKTAKLPKYYNSINRCEVIIEGDKAAGTGVEVIVTAARNKVFIGTETGQDVYRCIDSAVHKLQGQLRRKKTKERDNKHTRT
jgi:putative sigma-54 modulation protein